MEIDDIGVRRLSVAENIQREDLTILETNEGSVDLPRSSSLAFNDSSRIFILLQNASR